MNGKRDIRFRVSATFAAAAFALIGVAPASADVQIDYDLSRSRITAFAGLVELFPAPIAGTPFGGASARITLTGDGLDPRDGPARIEDFQLGNVPINANLFDVVLLQGSASAQQVGVAAGQLVAQSGVILSPAQPFVLATNGTVVCTPFTHCGAVGSFPLELAGIQSLTPLSFDLLNLDVLGRSTVHGRIELQLDGQAAVVDLVGVEVERREVPEPSTLGLLGAGCIGLVGIHGLAFRRRAIAA